MKRIPLSRGMVTFIDDADYEELNKYKWYAAPSGAGAKGKNPYRKYFYAGRNFRLSPNKRTTIFIHRILLNAQPGQVCDHINGNTLDNRRENLRIVTTSQNAMNSDRPSSRRVSKYRGVSPSASKKRSWTAQTMQRLNGKTNRYHLGTFKTEVEAAKAYDEKAKELFGEFARLNFKKSKNQEEHNESDS